MEEGMKESMKNNLTECNRLQGVLDTRMEELKKKKLEFEEENKQLLETIKTVKQSLSEVIVKAKEFALEEYNETGLKSLSGGFSIRVSNFLDYDPEKAFAWAKEHDLCLKLDTKAFDSVAKTQDFDFVEKKEKVMVCVPKKVKVE